MNSARRDDCSAISQRSFVVLHGCSLKQVAMEFTSSRVAIRFLVEPSLFRNVWYWLLGSVWDGLPVVPTWGTMTLKVWNQRLPYPSRLNARTEWHHRIVRHMVASRGQSGLSGSQCHLAPQLHCINPPFLQSITVGLKI